MQKIFLITVLISASYSSQVYVGGSLGVWSVKVNDFKTTSLNFYPEVGYVFGDNWHTVLFIGFGQTKTNDIKSSEFQITPYAGDYMVDETDH